MENPQTLSLMQHALLEAKTAFSLGEVPIGAIVVRQGEIIATAHNLVESRKDIAAHAEILALQRAAQVVGDWRLEICDMYVTLEPCAMCAQAISYARIRRLYFGAYNPKGGGVEHGARIFTHPTCLHKPEVIGGVEEKAAQALLTKFFGEVRQEF
jgi:tRNA(adenine34) deaminase